MINIREVRLAAGLSQSAQAERMGMSGGKGHGQKTVSQIEARSDWLLSSVAAYIKAAGGTADLVVTVGDEQIVFDIA